MHYENAVHKIHSFSRKFFADFFKITSKKLLTQLFFGYIILEAVRDMKNFYFEYPMNIKQNNFHTVNIFVRRMKNKK